MKPAMICLKGMAIYKTEVFVILQELVYNKEIECRYCLKGLEKELCLWKQ